jgi:Fic family protein
VKVLAKIDRRLNELKTPQTAKELGRYFAVNESTAAQALRELHQMGEVQKMTIKGRNLYWKQHE